MPKTPPTTAEPSESDDDKHLHVRLEPVQKRAYAIAAKKHRKTLSVWVRETLDAAAIAAGVPIE